MNNLFRLFGLIALIGIVFANGNIVVGQSAVTSDFAKSSLSIQTAKSSHKFTIEIATTERQQRQGLMFRRRLAADAGMLFIYSASQVLTMWMKNTYLPLDMLFIASDGRIVRIVQRTVPGSLQTISSGEAAIAVLELNGGTASRLKIKRGDTVMHSAFGSDKQ
ncbi:MAG: DUF192 domain-containing protein [Alphaproteobacteria bacterium]|nr:DUF192 domain-containing protein [Alphaproteobacteria bacterium]